MTSIITPQQNAIVQYLADGLTTIYIYNYLILQSADIAVYVTPAGQSANPVADLVPDTDYTVTGAGMTAGGTVVFDVAPPISSIVTITRNMQLAITTQFNDAQKFNGQSLDDAFQRIVLMLQQMQGNFAINAGSVGSISRCLQYVVDTYLPTQANNIMPLLTDVDNQVWISQGGAITAAVLQNDNMSTFRAQIASETPIADGASLVGYYDANNLLGQTLSTFLNNLPTYITNVVNAGTSSFKPGDMKEFAGTVVETGWLPCDGAAVSRVTYADLFAAIGETWGIGDGSTTFNVPDFSRRASVGSGGVGTVTLGNAVGDVGGSETHTMTTSELVGHTHDVTTQSFAATGATNPQSVNNFTDGSGTVNATYTTTSTGSATPFNIIQPSAVVLKIIKH